MHLPLVLMGMGVNGAIGWGVGGGVGHRVGCCVRLWFVGRGVGGGTLGLGLLLDGATGGVGSGMYAELIAATYSPDLLAGLKTKMLRNRGSIHIYIHFHFQRKVSVCHPPITLSLFSLGFFRNLFILSESHRNFDIKQTMLSRFVLELVPTTFIP